MPALYGCEDEESVVAALDWGSLSSQLIRVNARGILKTENNATKVYIAQITRSPSAIIVSGRAMRSTLGLTELAGDTVIEAPADRIRECPLLGLAVLSDSRGSISAHGILLLVQGTAPSKLEAIGVDSQSLTAASFRVSSCKKRCLMSEKETLVDLH